AILRLRSYTLGTKLADNEVLGENGLNRIADLVGALTPFVSPTILFIIFLLPLCRRMSYPVLCAVYILFVAKHGLQGMYGASGCARDDKNNLDTRTWRIRTGTMNLPSARVGASLHS